MTDQFDDPGSANAIKMSELNGRLLLIAPHKIEYGINTVNGQKDATTADIHILDGPEAGAMYTDVFIWSKVIQSQIRSNVGTGRFNLGRVSQGVAKPGQNPPWKLADPDQDDRKLARNYLGSPKFNKNMAAVVEDDDSDEPPF